MTELKQDSQSIRTVQTQPSTRKRVSESTETKPEASIDSASESGNEAEAAPKRKRRTTTKTTTTKTTKTKRQATSKSTKSAASTQVKLAWDVSQASIVGRFAQLEHELEKLKNQASQINAQSTAILAEMDELREISQKVQAPDRQVSLPPRFSSPLEPSIQDEVLAPEPADVPLESPSVVEGLAPEPADMQPVQQTPKPRSTVRSQTRSPNPASYATGNGHPRSHSENSREVNSEFHNPPIRRRSRPNSWRNWVLRVPSKPVGMAIDAVIWVLAATGLRIAMNYAALQVPIFLVVVNVLIFIPVLVAAYAALFVPQINQIGIYRLLLVTVGLIVGGLL